MSTTPSPEQAARPLWVKLLPIVSMVFAVFLLIGIGIPTLPLYVHEDLGFSTVVVGLVVGFQFVSSLLTRFWAGNFADRRGAKPAAMVSIASAVASGLIYFLSLQFTMPLASVLLLMVGRAALGMAESFILAASLIWAFALAGQRNAGMVVGAVGTPMYVAFAIGAPLGSAVYAGHGFAGIAVAAILIAVLAIAIVAPLRAVPPSPHVKPVYSKVLRAVWLPGLGLAFGCVGLGAIAIFMVLLFAQRGWEHGWAAMTVVSICCIFGRSLLGHLPDRIGGPQAGLIFILIEAAGQAMIWLAWSPLVAIIGAVFAGLGFSMIYPSFGVEVVRRVPPENRGLAMGAFTAFLDVALGSAGPALGLVADAAGLDQIYLASTLIVLCGVPVALRLLSLSAREKAI